jgi:hypothetical protein
VIAAFLPTPVPPFIAAFLYLRATLRSAVWRSHGLFHGTTNSATLVVCAAHPETAHQPYPISLKRCSGEPWPFAGRPAKHDLSTWAVTDDWLKRVPVSQAEVDVFEAWFGDLFDELFGPCP